MVCAEHVKGENVKKTISHTIGSQNSVEFAKYSAALSKDLTILYCTKNGAKIVKHSLDKAQCTDNGIIHSIPGTRKTYFFIKGAPYAIGFEKMTADISDYAVLFLKTFKILKTASADVAYEGPTSFIYKQGQLVNDRYERQYYTGVQP